MFDLLHPLYQDGRPSDWAWCHGGQQREAKWLRVMVVRDGRLVEVSLYDVINQPRAEKKPVAVATEKEEDPP